jgi:hypothetical protein
MIPAFTALAIAGLAMWGHAATIPVTGWEVHNGTSTVTNGGTNSPTFTGADNITVMGTFPNLHLANSGDFVKVTTTLNLDTRTANTGINALNTQLRIGLFDGPAGAVVAEDVPNLGIIIEYTNDSPAVANRRLIREQTSGVQVSPFTSPTNIGNGGPDTGNDSLQGANVGPVQFDLTLTRNGGNLDITGQISGTDSVSGNPYVADFSLPGYTPAAVGFNFDRVGFFFGGNVDAPNGTLNDVLITTNVPEPSSLFLAATLVAPGIAAGRRIRRRAQRP